MKNKINRIICFFVAFCICCTVLPQMVGVTADATEPKMSEKCETIIDDAGKNGSFGDAITDLRTSTSIKFSPSINLSNADVFEMDVYIENIEALNEVVSETQYIQFGFSSSSRRATLNHADANISEQLVANGWNHIEVKKADFIGANIDAVETADNLGIRRERAGNYKYTREGVGASYAVMCEAVTTIRSGCADKMDLGKMIEDNEEK